MLHKIRNRSQDKEQGFTLIELLVVILIIGILSAIAIPAFMNQRKSAVDATVQSDVVNAAKVVENSAIKGNGQPLSVSGDTSLGEPLMVGAQDVTSDVKKGTDAELKLEGTTNDYLITGTNPAGTDDGAKAGIVYNSLEGGLAKSGATNDSGNSEAGGEEADLGEVLTTKSIRIYDRNMNDWNANFTLYRSGQIVIQTDDESFSKSFTLDGGSWIQTSSGDISLDGKSGSFVNGKAMINVRAIDGEVWDAQVNIDNAR